ncbi:MAG: hypothetical protein RR787_04195 [Hydrogenoanaerobacterium sp.]
MADFSEMLSQLLSSDEGKKQVSSVINMLSSGSGNVGGGNANNSASTGTNNSASTGTNNSNSNNFDINALLSSLGASGNSTSTGTNNSNSNSNNFDINTLLASLGNKGNDSSAAPMPSLDIAKLMRVQQLLSQKRDDGSTALLRALKPHLGDANRKKVDEAVRFMEIFSLLPLIKESGLLGSLLGGDEA